MFDFGGRTVVLGVTGGIAAYKAAELCRLLVKAGAVVRVVMTEAATRFIAPLTMQTLSGAPVATNLFDSAEPAPGHDTRIGHIDLGDHADLILVAPATADTIARLAAGRADDLLSALILASRAPVLLAPAMNVNMWSNPITQQNLGKLIGLGRFRTVGPDAGDLACGWVGEGRLIEPHEIVAAAAGLLVSRDLVGRKVVVTAGPTFEPIDDVRFIGNRSSGKMGFAIAEAAARRGAEVTLIAGPVALATPPGGGIIRRDVETAEQMRAALRAVAAAADAVVMAAAVADFRPAARVPGKLSRRGRGGAGTGAGGATAVAGAGSGTTRANPGDPAVATPTALPLVANPDLLAELGRARAGGRRPLLVGFAAEIGTDAETLLGRAREKLSEKSCDVIVANDVGRAGLGFGSDDNAVTLVFADGAVETLGRAGKSQIADGIWDRLAPRLVGATSEARRARHPRRATIVRPSLASSSSPSASAVTRPVRPVRPARARGPRG